VDESDFAAFYRSSMERLVGFLVWQGAELADAADVAQEAMIVAHRCWPTIRRPQAWVRRTASRLYARRRFSVEETPITLDHVRVLKADAALSLWELQHDVLRELDALPPRQRQVMAWNLDGFTPAEIALELQMTPEAVRASLYQGRRVLALQLDLNRKATTR
jgi:RNA polymerase sigma-70 factor (ECF subfamily)